MSGPDFGYFPNPQKSVVVTKPSHLEEATRVFAECKMMITTEGTKYVGTPIGDEAFVNRSIEQKIAEWVEKSSSFPPLHKVSHKQRLLHSCTVLLVSGCSS